MKRLVVSISFLVLVKFATAQFFTVLGQDVGFVFIGPKVGTNVAQISNIVGTNESSSLKFGYQIGALAELGFTKRFSVDGELLFFQKGSKIEGDGYQQRYSIPYIGIPILAKWSFSALGFSGLYAKGGTFTNIRTGGSFMIKFDGQDEYIHELPSEFYSRVDWGLSLGFGAEYKAKHGIWGFDLRYDQGFVDITKGSFTEKNRNSSFAVSVVYKYDLARLIMRQRNKSILQS